MFTVIRIKTLTKALTTLINTTKTTTKLTRNYKTLNLRQNSPNFAILQQSTCLTTLIRNKNKSSKSKKHKEKDLSDEEEEDVEPSFEDQLVDRSTKIMKMKVPSMRLDTILKAGLAVSRNKIEVFFYESKIRLNGEKVIKKSVPVYVGDELDLIKGISPMNPNFLIVSRVEILDVTAEDETISVKIRRTKTLTIENYKESWKGTTAA